MPDPLTLRAHQVLCLQGFRGEGYSVTFIEEMTTIHRALADDPDHPVRLIAEPDRLCAACLHLRKHGCTLGGPGHEAHMRDQDLEVLLRLGLREGGTWPWREILTRIRTRVAGADLLGICTTCPWLPLGWCRSAMDGLRAPSSDPAPAGE